jgi:hypothetical protein
MQVISPQGFHYAACKWGTTRGLSLPLWGLIGDMESAAASNVISAGAQERFKARQTSGRAMRQTGAVARVHAAAWCSVQVQVCASTAYVVADRIADYGTCMYSGLGDHVTAAPWQSDRAGITGSPHPPVHNDPKQQP